MAATLFSSLPKDWVVAWVDFRLHLDLLPHRRRRRALGSARHFARILSAACLELHVRLRDPIDERRLDKRRFVLQHPPRLPPSVRQLAPSGQTDFDQTPWVFPRNPCTSSCRPRVKKVHEHRELFVCFAIAVVACLVFPQKFLLACSLATFLGGCPSNVETNAGQGGAAGATSSEGGTTSSQGGATTGQGASTTTGEGGTATECPEEQPFDGACTEGLVCGYGQECCCGSCYSSYVCDCFAGLWQCYYTDACYIPPCEQDFCFGFEGEPRFVTAHVGGVIMNMTASCEISDSSGPLAYAYTNSKSGPETYFQISACLSSQGSNDAPSFLTDIDLSGTFNVVVPYSQSAETTIVGPDGTTLGPSNFTTATITTWGAPHELVKGALKGTFLTSSGEEIPVDIEFSVCRRNDVIAL